MVLVPSRQEPFGMVAVEAALMSRPVIAADVGGLPEAVQAVGSGLLVAPDDPVALAAAIHSLLANPELGHSWARRGGCGR